jgi:hypothetical protein
MALPAVRLLSSLRPFLRTGSSSCGFRPSALFSVNFSANSSEKMSKSALILLAEGAEEMELVTPADVLRRAGVSLVFFSVAVACANLL